MERPSKRKHLLYAGIGEQMETKLARISERSVKQGKVEFTSIYHLINREMLKACHEKLNGSKAAGIDKITKDQYEENLEDNLADLIVRLKRKA